MFNGLDVTQGHHYIKLSCSTYIKKILKTHQWDTPQKSSTTKTPLPNDQKFIPKLENESGPTDPAEQIELATAMKFKYWQAIGELLFAAITCRRQFLIRPQFCARWATSVWTISVVIAVFINHETNVAALIVGA